MIPLKKVVLILNILTIRTNLYGYWTLRLRIYF
jgi:hypothetical protein